MLQVALIDDDPLAHRMSALLCSQACPRIELWPCTTLDDALLLARHVQPDIVIIDHLMAPHYNYADSVRALRMAGHTGQIIAMCSRPHMLRYIPEIAHEVSALLDKAELEPMINSRFSSLLKDHTLH